MEPELAIDASREAIKVCFMVGGPILGVCLIVGLLMGLAQAMSHIQDQALATVPKILAILAVVGFGLPWFADRMVDFSKDQFSRPFMAEAAAASWATPEPEQAVRSLLVPVQNAVDDSYYPRLDAPKLQSGPVMRQASHVKRFSMPQQRISDKAAESKDESVDPKLNTNPFSLPSYRYSRRPDKNIEG